MIQSPKNDVVAIVPARSGSKSIKDKNLQQIEGHSLLGYAVTTGVISKYISRVFVSTDKIEYANIAKLYGAETPFLRPSSLAADNSTDKEFFSHFFNWFREQEEALPKLVVHLRPTSPLRELAVIDKAIEFMLHNSDATALRSCHETQSTPYKMFYDEDGYMVPTQNFVGHTESYNLPRQFFPSVFEPNGHVDILRPEILIKNQMLHGTKIKLWKTDKIADIDDEEDLTFARIIATQERFRNLLEAVQKAPLGENT